MIVLPAGRPCKSSVADFLLPQCLSQIGRVEASKKMVRILEESEVNHFDGITTGNRFCFRYSSRYSKMFAHSEGKVISETRQATDAKRIMITVFFTAWKPIVFDVLPKGSEFSRLCFTI
jgi:hypothetical protein